MTVKHYIRVHVEKKNKFIASQHISHSVHNINMKILLEFDNTEKILNKVQLQDGTISFAYGYYVTKYLGVIFSGEIAT